MRLKLFYSIFVVSVCVTCYGSVIYNRNIAIRDWEIDKLAYLIQIYDGVTYGFSASVPALSKQVTHFNNAEKLINDFIDTCCVKKYLDINPGLHVHLCSMANNSIGRELIYRIIAKIIPRTECIASIDGVLGYVKGKNTDQDKLNAIGNFMTQLGVSPRTNTFELIEAVLKNRECQKKFCNLIDDPVQFHIGDSSVTISSGHTPKLSLIADLLIDGIQKYHEVLCSAVNKMLFDLQLEPTHGDYFKGNTVSIKGITTDVTFMSGPLLRTSFGLTGIATERAAQTVSEILFHEFSHYFRMLLENKPGSGELNVLKRRLYRRGFSEAYLYFMEEVWTDAEEINAIIGIFAGSTANSVEYDYLNESEFNLCVNKRVRISHNANHYTRVPYGLLLIIEEGRGESIAEALLSRKVLPYNAISDVI